MIKRYLKAFVLLLVAPIIGCEVIRDKIKENRAKTIIVAALISVVTICAFMPEQELKITDLSAAFDTGNKRKTTNYIVIHHTAGSADDNINGVCKIHYGNNKWSTIGYNYFIDKSGNVFRLKSDDEVAPHTYGHNDDALGIVCAGNFSKYSMPKAQYAALVRLTKLLVNKYNLKADCVKRHCDLNATECPGTMFDFETFIDDID